MNVHMLLLVKVSLKVVFSLLFSILFNSFTFFFYLRSKEIVGTVVLCEGGDDVFAFATVVPMNIFKVVNRCGCIVAVFIPLHIEHD